MKHIDGYLYGGIAIFGSLTGSFSTDEAKVFISPAFLFYGKTFFAAITAGLLAAKMYRSTTFSKQQDKDLISSPPPQAAVTNETPTTAERPAAAGK